MKDDWGLIIMRQLCVNVLSAADTASVNGNQIDANQLYAASFMAYFGDATAVGSVKLQISNDVDTYGNQFPFTVTNWVDLPNATAAVTAGGSVVISVPQMCYRWIRAVYTRTSGGSTTVNVNMNAFGF